MVPAVLYGHEGTKSVPLAINEKTVNKLLKDGSVNNTIFDLSVPEISWNGKTLLRELQTHPWKNYPYHLSFFAVAAHGPLEVEVPLHFIGEPYGVKTQGGVLETRQTQITVKCAADRIPEKIEVHIAQMRVGKSLHIADLDIPEGVTPIDDPKQTIVSILAVRGSKKEEGEEEEETGEE